MRSLPPLDIKKKINHAPHVVILGAGASLAAFPNGDAKGRRLPLMRDLVDVVGLRDILVAHGVHDGYDNFEALYDGLATDPTKRDLTQRLEERLHAYFVAMQLPDAVTLYDQLLLSLREKDLVATFNWDPFLPQAFRRNRIIRRLPRLAFLHGNVDVGMCRAHRKSGFLDHHCSECGASMEPSRLLFPVRQKDYTSDDFIRSEWQQIQWYMQHAYLVTIFGYSAPATDVEARSLLLKNWVENKTRELAEIDIVDIRPREEIRASWSEFIVRQHHGVFDSVSRTTSFRHPRRSCEAFAMATLQQEPWHENDFPRTTNLEELHRWVQPLLREEQADAFTGHPCPPLT